MTEFREILVLGLGRSGSNLLASILRNLRGNAGFFEIYFETQSQGLKHLPEVLEHLAQSLGVPAAQDSPELVAARDADPVGYFEKLSSAARALGYQSMSCKIFARQITNETLEALLKRPNISVVFLSRGRIERYISALKGQITGQYTGKDTTDLRPALSLMQFLTMSFKNDRELEAMHETVLASGVPIGRLIYETDLDIEESLRIERVTDALRAAAVEPDFARTATDKWVVKQDANRDWRDKIANGFEISAALAGLGLLAYAEGAPLDDRPLRKPAKAAQAAPPRDDSLLDQGGYNIAVSADPVITFTAIQYGRSFMAEWMAGPDPAFGRRHGVHFLKPTWTMETTDLRPLAETLRRAEACNPGNNFVAMHVSDREAQKYREVGIPSVPGNPNIFTNEAHFVGEAVAHPDLPESDAIYVARLAPWKQHELASGLRDPLFIYGDPVDPSEAEQFERLRGQFPLGSFINHRLGKGRYHYLGRQELASVMARTRVALALSSEEGCMRASVECLLAGLPMVSVPSIGGRDLLFTSDTALIVEPTPDAVRAGVDAMLARGLGRDEVRRLTLDRVRQERQRFLEAANRHVASKLGPFAPRLKMEPLLDFTIRYVPLRKMIEGLA